MTESYQTQVNLDGEKTDKATLDTIELKDSTDIDIEPLEQENLQKIYQSFRGMTTDEKNIFFSMFSKENKINPTKKIFRTVGPKTISVLEKLVKEKQQFKTESAKQSVELAVESAVEQLMEPAVEQLIEPAVEQLMEPAVEQLMEPAVEQTVKPVVKPVVEPAVESAVEQLMESAVEQLMESAVEPAVELAVEQLLEQSTEPLMVHSIEQVTAQSCQCEELVDDFSYESADESKDISTSGSSKDNSSNSKNGKKNKKRRHRKNKQHKK